MLITRDVEPAQVLGREIDVAADVNDVDAVDVVDVLEVLDRAGDDTARDDALAEPGLVRDEEPTRCLGGAGPVEPIDHMVDRVPLGLGLVGEVDDAGVMAANIMSVLKGDMAAMCERAREHALQFSWQESMSRLFGLVYRNAMRRALAKRVHGGFMSRLVEA